MYLYCTARFAIARAVPTWFSNNVVFAHLLVINVLQLMSPQLDMQQPVRTIGATTLEIQNKYVNVECLIFVTYSLL